MSSSLPIFVKAACICSRSWCCRCNKQTATYVAMLHPDDTNGKQVLFRRMACSWNQSLPVACLLLWEKQTACLLMDWLLEIAMLQCHHLLYLAALRGYHLCCSAWCLPEGASSGVCLCPMPEWQCTKQVSYLCASHCDLLIRGQIDS